ncbi:ADP-ribosylglycohydrolase [Catalinimonas alkaloidigena]|uniref:ADP-ribosylglycohydrolase n=1 Tax=Catalinimonas alkaloidigena TaxID=1075417 RepID=A0A1G9F329_9BACT|nr:ADP-ribosylglycohydrolase family protein [Catalinimonas alkaloidigena]SDK82761.1 ADP-ribosylglycohydrolase [Catalinimonas alkaloidigena]
MSDDALRLSRYRAALLGTALGDALGVPVEGKSREALRSAPITEPMGNGVHQQPPGTWSDDSALTFCLAESLAQGYNLHDLAQRFLRWQTEGHWSAHGTAFGIGQTTQAALQRLQSGVSPVEAGGLEEQHNGNGSLMRILPLAFYLDDLPVAQRYERTAEVSSLTHAHPRTLVACFCYLELARQLLHGQPPDRAFFAMQEVCNDYLDTLDLSYEERDRFERVLILDIGQLPADDIQSDGYVVHTLEAACWCLLTQPDYRTTVLTAVNLGDDADTTAAVAGGLAGIVYGEAALPEAWLAQLARREEIVALANALGPPLA